MFAYVLRINKVLLVSRSSRTLIFFTKLCLLVLILIFWFPNIEYSQVGTPVFTSAAYSPCIATFVAIASMCVNLVELTNIATSAEIVTPWTLLKPACSSSSATVAKWPVSRPNNSKMLIF